MPPGSVIGLLVFSCSEAHCSGVDMGEKATHFFHIFAARSAFDAAGHIDAVGTHDADRFGHIVRRQSAGQDDRYAWLK